MKSILKSWFYVRFFMYVLGLYFVSLGVGFAIHSNLGLSPVASFPYSISLVTKISPGTSVTIFMIFCVIFQVCILGKQFKWVNITQVLVATMFGFFVDLSYIFVLNFFVIPTYFGQLGMSFISLMFLSSGLVLYLEASLIHLPPEGLIQSIVTKFPHNTFAKIKIITDCLFVFMAISVTLIILGGIYSVREGTIISALFTGAFMPYHRRFLTRFLRKIGYYKGISKISESDKKDVEYSEDGNDKENL